jgi:ATP-dependent Zn protease
MRPNPWRATAYHEAGHAIMAYLLKFPFEKISIGPEEYSAVTFTMGKMYGFHYHQATPGDFAAAGTDRAVIDKEIQVLLAGDIADSLFSGHESLDPVSLDAQEAKNLAETLHESLVQVEEYLSRLSAQTEEMLKFWWPVLETVAEGLLKKRHMTYAEVCEIIARGIREQFRGPWQKRPA